MFNRVLILLMLAVLIALSSCATLPREPQVPAITREEAISIVMEEVISPNSLDHDVLAFLGIEPLKSGDQINTAFEETEAIKIDTPTWFAWIDDDPAAEFAHTTRYVFVDATNGAVNVLEREWWPLVNDEEIFQTSEELKRDIIFISEDLIADEE